MQPKPLTASELVRGLTLICDEAQHRGLSYDVQVLLEAAAFIQRVSDAAPSPI